MGLCYGAVSGLQSWFWIIMEEEKDAFYVVRKGDIVGLYKSFSECQAQAGFSVNVFYLLSYFQMLILVCKWSFLLCCFFLHQKKRLFVCYDHYIWIQLFSSWALARSLGQGGPCKISWIEQNYNAFDGVASLRLLQVDGPSYGHPFGCKIPTIVYLNNFGCNCHLLLWIGKFILLEHLQCKMLKLCFGIGNCSSMQMLK